MIKRLLVGLLIGLLMGAFVAAGVVEGLGLVTVGAFLAYVFAAVTGVVTGLVAGKPIWAKGAQIEAGLKAVVGAALGAAGMFAIRQWLHADVDLTSLGLGAGSVGSLPAVSLPLIAAVLGAFYELDNTPEPADTSKAEGGKPAAAGKKVRVKAANDEDEAEDEAEAPRRARR